LSLTLQGGAKAQQKSPRAEVIDIIALNFFRVKRFFHFYRIFLHKTKKNFKKGLAKAQSVCYNTPVI